MQRWAKSKPPSLARECIIPRFREMIASTTAVLFRYDPAGVSFGANTLEYEPEAQRIVPRLIACYSVEEFQAVIQEEICRSRGGAKAGLLADYAAVAQELWMNWQLQR